MLVDDELVHQNRPLPAGMHVNRLASALRNRGIGHLRILNGVSLKEIGILVKSLSLHSATEEARSTEHIRFGRLELRRTEERDKEGKSSTDSRKIRALSDIPLEELSTFMGIYEEARQNKKLNIVGISEIVGCFIDSFKQVATPLMVLAPLRAMDEYTFTHSTNVCVLNLAQAMALGIEGPLLHDIGVAAMLHDIGKLYVPEEVLTKPGKLNDAEWEMIKKHPVKGAQRLLDTPGVPRLAVVTAYEHHMKFNLSGYPRASEGWEQNICSHMTTISDVFDALRTKRSYHEPMEFDRIAAIMLELSGKDLHPVLTLNFLKIVGRLAEQMVDETGGKPAGSA
jgi:HD-GYP domain-containing protein (c-di-GMP phosphodiesterase class II)